VTLWLLQGVAARALNRLQVQPGEVRVQIEMLHPAGEQPMGEGQLGMTQQGKQSSQEPHS
jgi:hypothetical protein